MATYGSERSWEPLEEVTENLGDCKVSTDAFAAAAASSSRDAKENMVMEAQQELK